MAEKFYELLPDLPSSSQETYAQSGLRNVVRGGLKAATTGAGLTGDILQTALNLGQMGAQGVAESFGGRARQVPEIPITSEKLYGAAKGQLGKVLPEGYLESQGEGEKKWDEFVSDIAALISPLPGGKLKPVMKLGKAVGRAGLGQLASLAAEQLGFGKGSQAGAKVIAMTIPSLYGGRAALQSKEKEVYNAARKALPDKPLRAFDMEAKLQSMINKVAGRDLIDEADVVARLKKFKDKIKGGLITAEEVWDSKVDLNHWLETKDFSPVGKHYLEQARSLALKELETIQNPQFKTNFKLGDEIHGGLANNSKITKFLKKHVKIDTLKNPLIKTLLYGTVYHKGLPGLAKAAAGVGGAFGAKHIAQFSDFMKNSAEGRKYLAKVTGDALKENSKTIVRDVAKLDQLANEYQSRGQGGYILLD